MFYLFLGFQVISFHSVGRESECNAMQFASIVPCSNPFATVYMKESLSPSTINNRVLWVVEFVS